MAQNYYNKESSKIEEGLHSEFKKERQELKSAFDSIKSELLNMGGVESVPDLYEPGTDEIHNSPHEEFKEIRNNVKEAYDKVKNIIENNSSVTIDEDFYEPGDYKLQDGLQSEFENERQKLEVGFEKTKTKVTEAIEATAGPNYVGDESSATLYNSSAENLGGYYPCDELTGLETPDVVNNNNITFPEGYDTIERLSLTGGSGREQEHAFLTYRQSDNIFLIGSSDSREEVLKIDATDGSVSTFLTISDISPINNTIDDMTWDEQNGNWVVLGDADDSSKKIVGVDDTGSVVHTEATFNKPIQAITFSENTGTLFMISENADTQEALVEYDYIANTGSTSPSFLQAKVPNFSLGNNGMTVLNDELWVTDDSTSDVMNILNQNDLSEKEVLTIESVERPTVLAKSSESGRIFWTDFNVDDVGGTSNIKGLSKIDFSEKVNTMDLVNGIGETQSISFRNAVSGAGDIGLPSSINPSGASEFAISFWFNIDVDNIDTVKQMTFLYDSDAGQGKVGVVINPNLYNENPQSVMAILSGSPQPAQLNPGINPTANTWHHVVLQLNSNTGDGELWYDNSKVASSSLDTIATINNGSWFIGAQENGTPFPGALDEIMFFNSYISPDGIDSIYQAGV
jgi:hypothetical protein